MHGKKNQFKTEVNTKVRAALAVKKKRGVGATCEAARSPGAISSPSCCRKRRCSLEKFYVQLEEGYT